MSKNTEALEELLEKLEAEDKESEQLSWSTLSQNCFNQTN
ncbi:hypothetical protein C5L33_001799 [Lactobacillus pasteurii]|uniref:Uncharacterized protein n=1 Tax=Lactobacillus pasteurii DSM 23907 = CRBIP 24.76 TaxID=1423790 RepID=I7IYB5_9LACO|nr:hypothetical protein C5L33_001799 [Lactobacillus pasteurii]CCI84392.1 Protein of unknown function [Lactobacillus pasteurii DSM 23907 = CRBIP 24.76]